MIKYAKNVFTFFIAVVFGYFIYKTGWQTVTYTAFQAQYNHAVLAYYKIVDNFEKDKFTIVSSVDEIAMVRGLGWHYELSDLMYRLAGEVPAAERSGDEKEGVFQIPSDDVFFFIEKRPIRAFRHYVNADPATHIFPPEEPLKEEWAKEDILEIKRGLGWDSDIYNRQEYRRVVMAKAWYWMQEYQKYYAPEISEFFETDDIIVYHLHQQDPYALNNLIIDYGYN